MMEAACPRRGDGWTRGRIWGVRSAWSELTQPSAMLPPPRPSALPSATPLPPCVPPPHLLLPRPPRQPLPELLCDERHEGVQQAQAGLEADPQGVPRRLLGLRRAGRCTAGQKRRREEAWRSGEAGRGRDATHGTQQECIQPSLGALEGHASSSSRNPVLIQGPPTQLHPMMSQGGPDGPIARADSSPHEQLQGQKVCVDRFPVVRQM